MRTAAASLAVSCIPLSLQPSVAQDVVRIRFSVPLTGAFAENGKQMLAAAKLFMEQKGTTVAGRRIELITRDDGGVADQAKRIAQEFVVGVPAPDDRHAMSQT